MKSNPSEFLAEDLGDGDVTSSIFIPEGDGVATITCEENAIVAGLDEAQQIFSSLGLQTELLAHDGDAVKKSSEIMRVYGSMKSITTGERTALNFLMRMSGIATMTSNAIKKIRTAGGSGTVSGTRKTTPGFRYYEKKAISLGGGEPHRMGLYDMVLIKDNHIIAAGGIRNAMERLKYVPDNIKVEVEVENIEQARIAAEYSPFMIMLDNQSPEDAEVLYSTIKAIDSNIIVEVSGKVNMNNISSYAKCADRISMGCLTHSPKAVHFSLHIH